MASEFRFDDARSVSPRITSGRDWRNANLVGFSIHVLQCFRSRKLTEFSPHQTRLERNGAGYMGRRAPDFMRANSDWFRGIELKYGPDGGVFVADWTDLGECHDRDGIHRSSGRIYKIVYGPAPALKKFDLHDRSNAELVQLQLHRNDWYVRHARRILWERASDGQNMKSARVALLKMYATNPDVTRKLRALWALNLIGGYDRKWLAQQDDN
ncbi:MAG: hypothetical protein IIC80_03325 [Chloroflexi bacterium]|nr:hypothetical protein [Chloroflexota bacterium]